MPTMERLTLTKVHLRVHVTKNAISGKLKRVDQDGHSRHIYKGEDELGGCAATISQTSAESVGQIPFPWPQMAQRDVTDLQEAMGCVPVMDTLRDLVVVSSVKLYGPFHIPYQLSGDLRGFLSPPSLIPSLSQEWLGSSLEGRNHPFVLSPHPTSPSTKHWSTPYSPKL